MTVERWRVVPGYDDAYEVSDLGNVRSWKTYGNTKQPRAEEPHPLKPSRSSGYPVIGLSDHGFYRTIRVHRLVMELFMGPCPEGMQVAHNDGDRTNAALSNLRYATPSENSRDKILHGTINRGERHNLAKLTEAQAVEIIRRLDAGGGSSAIASEFGISAGQVRSIAAGLAWSHLPADPEARARARAARDCPNGHPRTPENVKVSIEKGRPVARCRKCQRAGEAAYRERKRQAAAA